MTKAEVVQCPDRYIIIDVQFMVWVHILQITLNKHF
jgi:hypothetical protein